MAGEKNWSSFKVPELKGELSARSLPTTGNKADLVARLQADDKKQADETAPAPASAAASGMNTSASLGPSCKRSSSTTPTTLKFAAAVRPSLQLQSSPSRNQRSATTTKASPLSSASASQESMSPSKQSLIQKTSAQAAITEAKKRAEKLRAAALTPTKTKARDDKFVSAITNTTGPAATATNKAGTDLDSVATKFPSVFASVSSSTLSTDESYMSKLTWEHSSVYPAEDEIDWEDDDAKLAEKPAEPAEPAQPAEPVKTEEPAAPEPAAVEEPVADEASTPADETKEEKKDDEDAKEPEAPKDVFAAGLAASSTDEEARKRAERAKRFGLDVECEEMKKAKRAEKFGIDSASLAKGLDSALPERPTKRGRGGQGAGDDNSRPAKRATPDRRGPGGGGRGFHGRGRGGFRDTRGGGNRRDGGVRRAGGGERIGIMNDPSEKARAEARAKRFAV
ncbi:hypothetical protein MKZ38_000697 [Zalerion maritima]|uniref:SAP domain-containing protein n=1 Tax=Zalerion maritima TaxID=339359 RepID=A0AAD5WSD2_9PEZI|nr:hypothetical protein MKZ38_000697 [Zalerion maritima]